MTIKNKAVTILLAIMMTLVIVPTIAFADDTESIAVTGISLDQDSITVKEGSSQTLTATVEPENATNINVLWSSDNESVATVDEGVVSGVSAGTAEITATTEEGSFTAVCTVNVENPMSGTCGDNLTWKIEDSTLTISGTGTMYDYSAGNNTTTAPWGIYKGNFTSLVIEDGVTSIGRDAFSFCRFTNADISGSVKTISSGAFSYCSSMTSISLHEGLTEIGNRAFYSCSKLSDITLPDSLTTVGEGLFLYCSGLTSFTMPKGLTSIGTSMFDECKNLSNIVIPENYTSIGAYAFYKCSSLKSIKIPSSVTTIFHEAFTSSGLTSIVLPARLNTIGGKAFNKCAGLTQIAIPSTTTTIGTNAFAECSALKTVYYYGNNPVWSGMTVNSGNTLLTNANRYLITVEEKGYTGDPVEPVTLIKRSGYSKALTEGTDYTINYNNNIDKGTAYATLSFKGSYSSAGTVSLPFVIDRTEAGKAVISDINDCTYTGEAITPELTITLNDTALVEGADYNAEFDNNINVGTATANVTFINDYIGSAKKEFIITQKDASSAIIEPIEDQLYTGKEIKPEVKVVLDGKELLGNSDYAIAYENNVNVGTATVSITFSNNFKRDSALQATFEIKNDVSKLEAVKIEDQTYTGEQITPKVVLKHGQNTLIEGTDYDVEYYDNIEIGTAKAVITGKGRYGGKKEISFSIKQGANSFDIGNIEDQVYEGAAIKPSPSVTFGGKQLTKDTDYALSYANNTNAGTASITVKGTGEYAGVVTKTFIIKPASLKKADLSTAAYIYNNQVKTPSVSVIGSVNTKALSKGTDYTVSYASGRKAVGKYSVTIKGSGNYQGTLTKYFTIKPSKAVTTSAKVTSKKMKVVAKAKASSYGGAGLQIAYKPSGGSWKYATTTSKTKAIKVSASKKYSVKTRAYKKVGGVTYYGDWSKTIFSSKKVKITFNANKGKVTTKSKKVWTNGKYGKLPKPKRSGYKFRGWYTKKSGGKKVTAKTYTKYYKNHTLYAHWFGPKGKGGKISKAEYNRIKYGMSYSDVCYLIGGSGDRVSSYTDNEWIEDSHEEWVDTGYWDYDYDYYGNEYKHWVDDGYYETVDDGYWESYYHETYGFKGQKSGYVEFEFVDDKLEEIYTYGFK